MYLKFENQRPHREKTLIPNHYKTAAKTPKIKFCNTPRAKTLKIQARKKSAKKRRGFPCRMQNERRTAEIAHFQPSIYHYKTREKNTGAIFVTLL